jgi:hypothetical protein
MKPPPTSQKISTLINTLQTADLDKKKGIIFEIRNGLKVYRFQGSSFQDATFAREFTNQSGVLPVIQLIAESSGNTLAYALAAFQEGLGFASLYPSHY